MKLFGHPVHPLLIHFPTAFFPMDLFLSGMQYYRQESSFGMAGFYCLAGGVILGLLAMVTGLLDFLKIPRDDKKAFALGLYHGFLNGTIILIFAVLAFKEWQSYPEIQTSMGSLIVKGILVLTLFAGNYLGGKLIYEHHIGIHPKTV